MDKTPPKIIRMADELQTHVDDWHRAGLRVGLVPTMGALHAGHISLLRHIAPHCERIIASIFVNPTQFAQGEDLALYPRDEAGDIEKLAPHAHLVYVPDLEQIYPPHFATRIVPDGVALGLEGDYRPHFFSGVATVVTKLLVQSRADAAIFGEKDYQQLCVIRQLVRDLNLGVNIHAAPTMREADSLAMSSRNAYLNSEARQIAAALPAILSELAQSGNEQNAMLMLEAAGFVSVDYATIRDAETLALPNADTRKRRALIAARVKSGEQIIRLIDNMEASKG